MKVNGISEFMAARGLGEERFAEVKKNTYKHTDCGVWIEKVGEVKGVDYVDMFGCEHEAEVTWSGVTIGCIVEGSDAVVTPITLKYPFEIEEFWKALESVNEEASRLWDEANKRKEMK